MIIRNFQPRRGFTLIELLVVIAVLGILAVGLIAVIDPADKIKSGNDTSAINTITQIGRANDAYAISNSNLYPATINSSNFGQVVTVLNTAGEIKFSTVTPPTGYTYNYASPPGCVTATPAGCTSYVLYTASPGLKSKKYTSTPFFWYANGKTCFKAAGPTASTDTCL